MYGCESWIIKTDKSWRTDAFELWCCRRLLRIPWTARRSNQSILKEISPGCSLEGLMLKLKLQSFGHLMQRTDSQEKTLMLGNIGGRRRRGRQRMRWLDGITDAMDMNSVNSCSSWWTEKPGVLQSVGLQRVRHDWATELNWVYTYIAVQLHPTLCKPMDCGLQGSSVHGISQARLLEWAAISSSRDLPGPGIESTSPAWQRILYYWAFREVFELWC